MIGTVINNYRILGPLDESGGMGVVYRAEHVTMGQRAVIKLLRPQIGQDPQGVARFLNEARAAAAIDDPGIVKVFDQGVLPDGSAYLTMEHLAGETLRARLQREGRLPPEAAVAFARQAARVVGAAHRLGIIHRDLKPENLFLCPDPEVAQSVRVKVLDFGIAKLSEGASGVVTQAGLSMGTPAYMAPEQWRSARDADARTDVYALGCVLYEMLLGRVPFPGPSLPEFMDQHRFQPPALPSAFDASLVSYDAVIQRTLAKSPAGRFASMEALMAALPGSASGSWSSGAPLPVTGGPAAMARPTPAVLGGAPERRPRSAITLVLVGLVLGGGGLIAGILLTRGKAPGPPPAPPAAAPPMHASLPAADAAPAGRKMIVATGEGGPPLSQRLQAAREPSEAPPPPAPDAAPAPSAPAAQVTPACTPVEAPGREVSPVLGRPAFTRGRDLIVDFRLDDVAPGPEIEGAGGITTGDRSLAGLGECSDSPTRDAAAVGTSVEHSATGLRVEVTEVEPAGRSGRGWRGVRCGYRLTDRANADLYADLGSDVVPAFNALTGLVRDGNVVYATLQFNGYAKEVKGLGNRVVALDLCAHRVLWRSADMVSNAALLLRGDTLITGYGFTAEPDYLYVLNRWTGAQVQRIKLPKSPEGLRVKDGKLFVRLYDGYASFVLK